MTMTTMQASAGWRDPLELTLGSLSQPLNWPAVFGNDGPVQLEIGCGKGRFLLAQAQVDPACNWLGIELRRKYFKLMLTRARKRQLDNVRLLCGDAAYFLTEYVPADSLQAVHIYFPDPWPKKRHHKRRIFQPEIMATVQDRLQPGGRLLVATDHAQLAEVARDVIGALPDWAEFRAWEHVPSLEQARTNYEIKWLQQGRTVHEMVAQKAEPLK